MTGSKSNTISRSLARRQAEQGFTLLELMIALSVSMIVILTISITMINASRSVMAVRQDSLTNSFLSSLSQILRDPQLCKAAFVTAPAGALGAVIDVNPATHPTTVPRIEYCPSPPCTWPSAVLAEALKRTGGDLNGVQVTSMKLDNPTLVAGARYRWSLKITTDKLDAQGVALPGATQVHNFRVTITTNDGSPDYHVISCGIELKDPLSVPPPPIVMGRSLLTLAQANAASVLSPTDVTKTVRDDECQRLGSDHVPATLLDMVQLGAAPGDTATVPAGAQPFLVQDDTTNAYALLHLASTAGGMEIHNLGNALGQSGQVACVHRTAPIRFTSSTALGANFAANAGQAVHDLECDKAFGSNYVSASYSDLFAYGFVEVPTGLVPTGFSRDVTLGGTSNTCRIGYMVAGSALGPVIDCTQAANQQNQIGCVIRSN